MTQIKQNLLYFARVVPEKIRVSVESQYFNSPLPISKQRYTLVLHPPPTPTRKKIRERYKTKKDPNMPILFYKSLRNIL